MKSSRPTEAVLEASRDLDDRSLEEVLATIHGEDHNAWLAVGKALPTIAEAAEVLVCALGGGGRWFNVGAGTSGRMGTLDAAEITPTFGLPAGRVQAVMAGGTTALTKAVEGAEDNAEAGAWELRERGLVNGDAVVAVSASGHTPFTLGALDAAHEVGARTICITSDPCSPLAEVAEISIVPETGPEVIAGSTRMKAGLAQKMVLHLLSTSVMVRLGYVTGNLMTHLRPASSKLRERAERIVMELAHVDQVEAARLLSETDGDVAIAIARANCKPE
jgi:N-acetylmuramic acid 6-phosphate etherase